jgi:hypothetical protein
MTLLAFVLCFILFIVFPSRFWNFDGVACAAALELGNPLFFFHSNHLLYGFLGYLFWKPLALLGALPRALPALQLFTGILSSIGLAGLYVTIKPLFPRKGMALLLTWATAATAVVWVWSVEAQVYALGFAALGWATAEIFKPESPKKWIQVGALHGAAILGHIVHGLWIFPAFYWLWRENRPASKRHTRQYLITLAAVTIIPYLLVLVTVVSPTHTHDPWMKKWILGSLALNAQSAFQWHSAGWTGPLQWAQTTLRIFWGSFWPYFTSVPFWSWVLTGVSILGVVFLLIRSYKKRKEARWVFCAIWLGVYAIFFWTWEPTTECYRMTDMIPLTILLGLGISTYRTHRTQWALVGMLVLTLLPINLVTRIQPMHDAQRNVLYQEIMHVVEKTPSHSIYLTTGGMPWIYILYFSGRTAWNLRSFMRDPERLGREIKRHMTNYPFFIRMETALTELNLPWLSHYKPRPVDPALPWMQLQ